MNRIEHVPDGLPVLSKGFHDDPSEGACLMEYVSLLAGEAWSDSPACTHPVLAEMARTVNDWLPDTERHRLVPLIGRLFGTAPTGAARGRHVLSVRLAVWCGRQVFPLVRAEERAVCEGALDAAEGWCEGRVGAAYANAAAKESRAAAYAAYAAAAANAAAYAAAAAAAAANANASTYTNAANATYAAGAAAAAAYANAAANAANAAANAAYAAGAAANAVARYATTDALVDLLTGLLDEYDRLVGRTEHREVSETDLRDLAEVTA